ncbi:uncharacterized protein M437DRAFT_46656, partial [Aureobasidium melanogenum CBS 110374]
SHHQHPNRKMCHWRKIHYIYCRHTFHKVFKCSRGELRGYPCADWDDEANERLTLNHNGRPYIPAVLE